MVHISVERRARIYALVREGYPSRYVAKKESVSQSSVVRISQKAVKTGSVKDLPKSGRPREFTERDERNMIRLLASGECSNAVEIQKKLKIDRKIETSENTVRRILRKNGLSSRVKRKKPVLTERTRRISKPDELWEVIQKVWVDMDIEYLNKLIESMPQRVMDVFNARGGYTE
ncbi:42472_t:CDS:2, partial [Gigaspora margarita]